MIGPCRSVTRILRCDISPVTRSPSHPACPSQVVPESFLERLFGMTDTQKSNSSWCDTAYILFYSARQESES
eukprot:m.149168 g.149168  ORF g.149168 m.149168 type:complete len:72 (-) comp23235_c0_seq17:1477-1692(-)